MMEQRLALAGLIGITPLVLLLIGVIYFPTVTISVMLAIVVLFMSMAIGVIALDIYDSWKEQ